MASPELRALIYRNGGIYRLVSETERGRPTDGSLLESLVSEMIEDEQADQLYVEFLKTGILIPPTSMYSLTTTD